jgi:PQQ-dependent dehydrogenase (methanol/ethanol family)
MSRHAWFVLPAALVAAAAGCAADTPSRAATGGVTDQVLEAAPGQTEGWHTYGRDWGNQRYSPLAEIDRRTVATLRPVWRHDLGVFLRRSTRNESTPLVVGDLLLYTDLKNLVIAVDVRSGKERWRYQPSLGPVAVCCNMVNRGVASYGDKIYLATLDARLIALRRRDGSVAWDVRAGESAAGYSFTMAPLAADGRIIVGASGGEFQIRGFVDAYDPESGRRIWRFWTTASPEEGWYGAWTPTTPEGDSLARDLPAERRDSARYAESWRKGGAPVWSTPAYDPALGLLYFGTGEPSRFDGVLPPGDNLYSTALVAVEIATGRLRWYYQMVPHDQWNLDAASPTVLCDVADGDSVVPAVVHAGKTGWVYILDRRTGRRIRRSDPFVPVERVFAAPTAAGVRVSPGFRGGASWPPPAYSPTTGLLYVLGSHIPMRLHTDSAHAAAVGRADPFTYPHYAQLPDSQWYGVISAVDLNSGKIRWQQRVRHHLMYSGALATEGGLVFYGDPQGGLNAADAATGRKLWRAQVAHAALGPPITFQVDGHQRIAVTSQSGIAVFGLPERIARVTPPRRSGPWASEAPDLAVLP